MKPEKNTSCFLKLKNQNLQLYQKIIVVHNLKRVMDTFVKHGQIKVHTNTPMPPPITPILV